MNEVKSTVSKLVQTLESEQEEVTSMVDTVDALHRYLDGEAKRIIQENLDKLLNRIKMDAARINSGLAVVLVSPEGTISVGRTYDMDSDSWLKRLKSQGFYILTLNQLSDYIDSLKTQQVEGIYTTAIEFLRANTESISSLRYSDTSHLKNTKQPDGVSTSSQWKLSDFLPAGPPYPPLPRGLFK